MSATGRSGWRPGGAGQGDPDEVTLQGSFVLTEAALREAERLLPTFRGADGDHEGLVFLAGREIGADVVLLCTAIAPRCAHGPGSVQATELAVRDVARAARQVGLAVLAQVHSHPGAWTGHSRGDDRMVLLPFEGMLSVVVPHYGRHGMRPISSLGVHQFRNGGWRRVDPSDVRQRILIAPSAIDLR